MKSEGKESIEYYLKVSSYGYPETEKRARDCMRAHKMEKFKKKKKKKAGALETGFRSKGGRLCDREPVTNCQKQQDKNFQENKIKCIHTV